MFRDFCVVISLLLSLTLSPLVAMESCPATGMPGMPGIPGLPGRDGRDGEKGQKGEAGAVLDSSATPEKGQKGEPGPKGPRGKRGQSGEQGIPGAPGSPGPQGPPGEHGTTGVQHKVAFSVARGTYDYPDKASVIRFTNVITNIDNVYSTDTGHFRCTIPGIYYFVFHASIEDKLCVLLKMDQQLLTSFCDHRRNKRQVTSGGLAVYMSTNQEVWLETKDYRGMTGRPAGFSIFSGFLVRAY